MASRQEQKANVRKDEFRSIFKIAVAAMLEKGYTPLKQIEGYIISGDPAYITDSKNARALISRFDGFEILDEVLKVYAEAIGVEVDTKDSVKRTQINEENSTTKQIPVITGK